MTTVRAQIEVSGSVHEAESLWLDTARWPTWVDGLARVERVQGGWPDPGGRVVWDSTPAGRGRVVERILEREPLASLTLGVEDETLHGTQRVRFTPAGTGRTRVALELDYRPKSGSPLMPVIDWLFVRRPVRDSLRLTLHRFAIELDAERTLHP